MERSRFILKTERRVDVSKDEVEVVRLVRDSVVAMHESGMTVALEVALDEDVVGRRASS